MPKSTKYNTIFVHIPKTAGSAIENMLEIENSSDNEIQKNVLFNSRTGNYAYQHYVPKDIIPMISEKEWTQSFKFTIVREPYERIISSFNFMKVFNMNFDSVEDFLIKSIQVRNQGEYDTIPFYHHFRPQSDYFENITYDYIGRFDTLSKDIEYIKSCVGCENELPVTNRQEYKKEHEWTRNELLLFDKVYREDLVLWEQVVNGCFS